MKLTGYLFSIFTILIFVGFFILLINNALDSPSMADLKPPVVIAYMGASDGVLLKGAGGRYLFIVGTERSRLMWDEHAIGDTLRAEEMQ